MSGFGQRPVAGFLISAPAALSRFTKSGCMNKSNTTFEDVIGIIFFGGFWLLVISMGINWMWPDNNIPYIGSGDTRVIKVDCRTNGSSPLCDPANDYDYEQESAKDDVYIFR